MLVLVLLIIAAVVFGIDFLAGVGPVSGDGIRGWRFGALAWCLVCVALALWHGGR